MMNGAMLFQELETSLLNWSFPPIAFKANRYRRENQGVKIQNRLNIELMRHCFLLDHLLIYPFPLAFRVRSQPMVRYGPILKHH